MFERIAINPNIHFGKPCVVGTRIPIQSVLELLSEDLSFEDDRFHYDEQRFVTIGLLSGEFVVIAHTEVGEDVTRIISMRKATKHEEIIFFKAFGN